MTDGRYAIYKGKKYSAGKVKNGKIILRSETLDDLENGFEKCEPFSFKNNTSLIVCTKLVDKKDITEFYKINTIAIYRGYEFEVIEQTDTSILIETMTGNYRKWLEFGMKCIDKGVYQKWVNKDSVVLEERKQNLVI